MGGGCCNSSSRDLEAEVQSQWFDDASSYSRPSMRPSTQARPPQILIDNLDNSSRNIK